MSDMRRREFITLLGGAVTWPLAARAQQPTTPVVGFLNTRAPGEDTHLLAAFRQGLSETGYVEGKTVAIEYRWAEGHNDRLPALAADLVRRRVTVIAANSQATIAARAATTTIPIVFITGADPVQVGFVASLNRPGGNLTGVASLDTELGRKRLQLLHELLPKAGTIAALVNPTFPRSDIQARDLQAAASTLGLRLHILHASTVRDINTAFATLARLQASGLVGRHGTGRSLRRVRPGAKSSSWTMIRRCAGRCRSFFAAMVTKWSASPRGHRFSAPPARASRPASCSTSIFPGAQVSTFSRSSMPKSIRRPSS